MHNVVSEGNKILGRVGWCGMSRYIDAELIPFSRDYSRFVATEDDVDSVPTADVVEVRHGRWEEGGRCTKGNVLYVGLICSECHFSIAKKVNLDDEETMIDNYSFCPSCGARMDGESKETSQEATWTKNLELLRSGGFGSMNGDECFETLLKYWKMQEQAGFPSASENVKYFEDLIKRNTSRLMKLRTPLPRTVSGITDSPDLKEKAK